MKVINRKSAKQLLPPIVCTEWEFVVGYGGSKTSQQREV